MTRISSGDLSRSLRALIGGQLIMTIVNVEPYVNQIIVLRQPMAIFTLEYEQIVWSDNSSQMDKSSDVKTGQLNFQMALSSEFVRL